MTLGRLLNLLTALSLLLCVAVAVLWARTHLVADTYRTAGTEIVSVEGGLAVVHGTNAYAIERGYRSTQPDDAAFGVSMAFFDRGRRTWGGGGFAYASRVDGTRMLFVPYWAPAGLFALLPAVRAARHYRRPRRRPGHCAACGYDLHASPHRCPECGAAASVNTPG